MEGKFILTIAYLASKLAETCTKSGGFNSAMLRLTSDLFNHVGHPDKVILCDVFSGQCTVF